MYFLHPLSSSSTSNHFTKSCSNFLLLPGILVSYCSVTNYYKLKQCRSLFLWVRNPAMDYLGPLLRASERCNWVVSQVVFIFGSLVGGGSAPQPIQIVVKINLLIAVWGPSCFVGCQVEAALISEDTFSYKVHIFLLEPTHSFLPRGFLNMNLSRHLEETLASAC